MRGVLFFILTLFLFNFSFGQSSYSTKSKKAIKLYKEAELLLRQRKFPQAIEALKSAVDKDGNFTEAHLRLAFSYELLQETNAQQYHLEQVIRIEPNNPRFRNVYYSLGKVYFNQGRYEQSGKVLEKLVKFGITNARMQKDVIQLRNNIEYAVEHMQNPLDIHPQPLTKILNAYPLQYFPVLTADEKTIIYTARDGKSFHDDENIVISQKDESGQWTKPVSISPNINSQFNEGTCTISTDGRVLIFTNCDGRQRIGSCDLYVSYKTGEEWSVPKNLGKNINSMSWDSQPALSADGRKLFFVSDRAGGFGKRDIWVSKKNHDGIWQRAENVGPEINTKEDEVSPFIHVNGITLFFASKGYPGFGGFDLYKSELQESTWSNPENLGYPLNTHEDQVSLFVSTNGKSGYYSYERNWNSKQSQSFLYSFEFPSDHIIKNRSIYLTGHIYDIETNEPLDASIELYNVGSEEPSSIFSSDPVSGKYFTILNANKKIALYIDREGYLFESRSFEIDRESGNSIVKNFYLKPIKKGNSVLLNNLFFEFNSASITLDSKTELLKIVQFLLNNPATKILIAGHTDDLGTEEYNKTLSTNRAKSVYDFLINQGIKSQSLSFTGFGESKPLVDNKDQESRKTNRRIEFIISN